MTAVPRAVCGPGSRPETGLQGRMAAEGTTCNTELVSHFGTSGGYKVERYVDTAGHECAYYDTTLLFPTNVGPDPTGVYVLDMADPTNPVRTEALLTPAMESPHESMLVNSRRGLVAAVLGNPIVNLGVVDVYDASADCRHPVLKSTSPAGILGHESGFAPDGNTFWSTSLSTGHITAVDVTDPSLPMTLGVYNYASHGMTISDDGNRAYLAARNGAGEGGGSAAGLIILDVSQVQARVPNPQVSVVGRLTWPGVSIPQVALPVKIGGHPYLVEIDEFAGGPVPSAEADAVPGVARIIDIADDTKPFVVSNIRLDVHTPEGRAATIGDPDADSSLQGYAGHYCNVPRRDDPGIVACSLILSGLRVFDIRDPLRPKEIAYFNPPTNGGSSYAMSSPSFVPERSEIWYSDGNSGFYNVRVTNGVWPFPAPAPPTAPAAAPPAAGGAGRGRGLPATGIAIPVTAGLLLLGGAIVVRRRLRATSS